MIFLCQVHNLFEKKKKKKKKKKRKKKEKINYKENIFVQRNLFRSSQKEIRLMNFNFQP